MKNYMKRITCTMLAVLLILLGQDSTAFASDFGLSGGIDWWDTGEAHSYQQEQTTGTPTEQEDNQGDQQEKEEPTGSTAVSLGYSGAGPGTGTYGDRMSFQIPWETGRMARAGDFANLDIVWKAGYDYNFALAPGFPIYGMWCAYYADGQLVYCMEPKNLVSTQGTLLSSSTNWNMYSHDQQKVMGYIAYYGNQDGNNVPEHIATQALIWEICLGYRDANNFQRTNNYIYNGLIAGRAAESHYNNIVTKVQTHTVVSSLMSVSEAKAPTYKLESNGSGSYIFEDTDSNSVLANFSFPSIPGVTFAASGSKLTITSNQPINPAVMVECNKTTGGNTASGNWVFWLTPDATRPDQVKGNWRGGLDPVAGYFQITTDEVPPKVEGDEYKIRIIKRAEGTGELLAGAEFEVRHTAHGVVDTYLTDSSGTLEITVPWPGTYILTEISCPLGYVMPPNPTGDIYVDTDNPIAERTFYNAPYTGIKITKVDAFTGQPLANAVIKIQEISTGVVHTKTTGADGIAYFTDLRPGEYFAQEITSPSNYVLNDTIFPVSLESNKLATITIPNEPFTGVLVTKVDAATGVPLANATIKLQEISTGVEYTQVTGVDGIAHFKNLPPADYYCQEIVAPSGYAINDRIFPISLESNKLATVTIPDEKKGGLYIYKVDPDGNPIAGAVFELRRNSGEVISREITNKNGLIYRGNLTTGLYICEEIQAPSGFILDPNNPQSIFIDTADENKEFNLTFVNQRRPAIEILKVDAANPSRVLAGASFVIAEQGGSKTWTITTDYTGKARLDDLDPGITYLVTETISPSGYLPPTFSEPIVLEVGRCHTITVENHKAPKLTISKIDEDTGLPLPQAIFRVTYNNGTSYQDVTTGADGQAVIEGLPEGWLTIVEIKSPEGWILDDTPISKYMEPSSDLTVVVPNKKKPSIKIIKEDSLTGSRLAGATFKITRKDAGGETLIGEFTTDENGEILLEVEPGRYFCQEIKAPNGFLIDDSIKEIIVDKGVAVYTFTNTAEQPIVITKIDPNGKPLAGAVFRITTVSGQFIAEVTSGRNGYAVVPADPGHYLVEEIRSPTGYLTSNQPPVLVELRPGIPASVEVVNDKAPSFTLLKLDSETREPILSARFRITTTSGELIGEFDTDINGRVHLETIDADTQAILVTEIRAADGYTISNQTHTVQISPNKEATLTVYNKSKPGLQIRKIDSETLLPVSDCVFNVQFLDGGTKKDFGNFTSGENGLIYIPDLTEGYYEITEIKAKQGYIQDSVPKTIFAEASKLNTVEFRNQPYSNAVIRKVSEDGKPLSGAIFRVYDENRLEIGSFESNELGEIVLNELTGKIIYIQEVKAPSNYVLDSTVHKVELRAGSTVTIQMKNTEMGSLRLLKRCAESGKPLPGVTFLLYDAKNNIMGEFVTDQSGLIVLPSNIPPQKIRIKEIKTIDGYVLLNDKDFSAEIRSGETCEIVIENEPERGRIRIVKKADDDNSVTKDKKGKTLAGAKFQILNEDKEVVDTITTGTDGVAVSDWLPLGKYAIREKASPDYYLPLETVFYAEIKKHKDTVEFEVFNEPVIPEVSVEKRGNVEALTGDSIRYDFSNIQNLSNVPLNDFYWHDQLPTDAVRLEKIFTGTWNERLVYKVEYRTNLKTSYRTLESGLHSNVNNEIDCSPSRLKLAPNEYITDFRFQFGTVKSGFKEVEAPFIFVKVLEDLTNEYRFVNKTDVGGRLEKEWIIDKDAWVTIIYRANIKKGNLPKTGF